MSTLTVDRRVCIHWASGLVSEGVIEEIHFEEDGVVAYHVVASGTRMSLGWHSASVLEPLEADA